MKMVFSVNVGEHTASIFGVYKSKKPIVLVLLDPEYYGLSLPLENIGAFQSTWCKFRRLGI